MASDARSSEIARAVRRLLARPASMDSAPGTVIRPVGRSAVMGGIAMLALAPAAVNAVGFGEAQLRSALGEPLRATVPLRLANGEVLRPGCVTTQPGKGGDLRSPTGTRVRSPAATGPAAVNLEVTSSRPLYEPLYELTLQIDCPGLPRVMRHYVLMLDLPGLSLPAAAGNTSPERASVSSAQTNLPPSTRSQGQARLAPTRDPVRAGTRYRVREGDTLSQIAARVENRSPNTTWQLADKIFENNPGAFINGNPDLIKLGYEITIPVPSAVVTAAAPAEPVTLPQASAPAISPTLSDASTPALQTAPELETPIATPVPAAEPAPAIERGVLQGAAVETPGVATDTVPPATSTSPFADVAEPEPTVADVAEPPPLVPAQREPARVSPLLAVLLGLLLGLGLSILLLRSRLLDGLSKLFMRRRTEPAAKPEEQIYADTDEWLKTTEGLHADPLALGSPAEQTYIVEVDEASQTAGDEEMPVADRMADFDVPFAPPDDSYEPDLGTEAATAAAEPDIDALLGDETAATAEMPRDEDALRAAPTAEISGGGAMAELVDGTDTLEALESRENAQTAETVEMPAAEETGETVAMPEVAYDPAAEPDLAELFADGLSGLPAEPDLPVEVFAGMEDDDADMNPLAPTVDMPGIEDDGETVSAPADDLEGLFADSHATEAMDLQGLSNESEAVDTAQLSDTLQEAMSMLEKDFSEELTASQIVDQSGLRRAISESGFDDELEQPDAEDPPRKRAS